MGVQRGRSVALATRAHFIVGHREEEGDENWGSWHPRSYPLGRLGWLRMARLVAVATWAQCPVDVLGKKEMTAGSTYR